ncbi:thrombomodulin [Hippoglossus hippoglossus]|uniref:thrombomodulin n=1 Tax=Hippoglossus hippoglossus TaxID=8267 RepID=UPI00148E5B4D|nr:thrombomodulin [Hippoglossus hippoglossus]XP_034436211.1 thrombomodulin [Hippoglossus hippoglossus]
MRDVTGLFAAVLVFLLGRTGGIEQNNGYCIGTKCFAVAQESSDFTTAQRQCRSKGGHLMTVRSSVSHDVLFILLGNSTGRFWIGLHLSIGCPDVGAGLRGFQWVTKDSQSDFFNWAPGFDSSCSSHRCVSVSRAGDFTWVQETCGEQAAGFLCEIDFSNPCTGLNLAQDESVSYSNPMGFGGEDWVSVPPGSTATRRPSEIKYVCFSEKWLQAPWSCEISEGGCEHKCATDPNKVPACYCPQGQTVNPANKVTCEVGIEDPCQSLSCAHACYATGDSYACLCDHGFKLAADGRSCVDFNDCTDQRQCPGENFMCVNTVGGFQCACKAGYMMTGGLCVDQDECASAPCEHMCKNTPGSYLCSCYDGYEVDPAAPNKCKLHCGMERCAAECDPNDALICYCPDGYVSEERHGVTVCIDLDECEENYCEQRCENKFGGYVCSCYRGYELLNEYMCVEIEDSTGEAETTAPITSSYLPYPEPTRRPSGVSVGAFVGIILCTVFFIVSLVFLARHILNRRGKIDSASALTAREDEAHGLRHLTSYT